MGANVKSKILSTITLAVVCLLLFSVGFYSFAWFSTMIDSGDIGFSAGELSDDGKLEIARIAYPNDSASSDELDESKRQYTECENMHIEHGSLPVSDGNGGYTITMDRMSFGRIDNVALLKPENVVYFRLSVPKINGESVKIKFYYNEDETDFVDLYKNATDGNGNPIQEKIDDADILEALQTIENRDSFIRFSACISNTAYEATQLSTLTYYGEGGVVADETSDTYYRLGDFDESSDDCALFVNEDFENAGDNYYVYIRVEPNLSVFGQSIESISSIMPCFIYFKIKAYFEVYEGGQE